MATIDLEHVRRRGNADSIANASPTEIAASVVALCGRCEESGAIDFDELLSIGLMLTVAGHLHSDEIIIGWLENSPTALRLDISSALLVGAWMRYPEKEPVSPVQIARLVAARPKERLSPDAEYSYAQALARILRDPRAMPEVVRLATQELQNCLVRGTGLAMTDESLADLVHDSMERVQKRTCAAPLSEFVAHDRQEQGRHHFAIEYAPTATEVLRVLTLLVTGRTLLVEYRIGDPNLTDDRARALIFHAVLVSLCRDVYKSHVDEVRYVNLAARTESRAPYAPF